MGSNPAYSVIFRKEGNMKFFYLLLALMLVNCGNSAGPTQNGNTYCVESLVYHLEQPGYRYTEDWLVTAENTYRLTLFGSDTLGTFSSDGIVSGVLKVVYGDATDTLLVSIFNGPNEGQWATSRGRLLFSVTKGNPLLLADPDIYNSAPTYGKFISSWEYPKDPDGNYAFVKIEWKSCN